MSIIFIKISLTFVFVRELFLVILLHRLILESLILLFLKAFWMLFCVDPLEVLILSGFVVGTFQLLGSSRMIIDLLKQELLLIFQTLHSRVCIIRYFLVYGTFLGNGLEYMRCTLFESLNFVFDFSDRWKLNIFVKEIC